MEYDDNFVEGMHTLGRQIAANNALLLANVQSMVDRSNRKKRKRRCGEILIVSEGSYLGIRRLFDDGTNDYVQISKCLTGPVKVYNLEFQTPKKPEHFGIFFKNEEVLIIGEKKRVKPEYLYDCFLKSVGPFRPDMSKNVIGKVLYEYFAVKIEQAESVWRLPVLAGWNHGKFLHRKTYPLRKTSAVPELPVLQKNFESVPLTDALITTYFEEFLQIARWKERLLICIFPFVGILASVFREMHKPVGFYLNFIEIINGKRQKICSWIKVFNRNMPTPFALDTRESEVKKILKSARDEVLIFDAKYDETNTNYEKSRLFRNVKNVIKTMRGEGGTDLQMDENPCFTVAFFSERRILEEGCYNIFVDSKFIRKNADSVMFIEGKVMEAVLSDFVHYAEENIEKIWKTITQKETSIIKTMCQILSSYWEESGINLMKMLNIPCDINWKDFFKDQKHSEDEILPLLCEILRKWAKNFYAIEKHRGIEAKGNAFYYSEEYLWIPTTIFHLILAKEGLRDYKNGILLSAKEQRILLTDGMGFSRRIHMEGRTVEVYQFQRSFFNKVGSIDIIDLAKGGENAG